MRYLAALANCAVLAGLILLGLGISLYIWI